MSVEKAKEFLKTLESDTQLKNQLNGLEKPADEKEIPTVYAKLAAANGYDVTADEMFSAFEAKRAEQAERARLAMQEIQQLSDSELDSVAGGNDRQECWDTFKDYEACWFADACDLATNYYYYYKCNFTHDDWKG